MESNMSFKNIWLFILMSIIILGMVNCKKKDLAEEDNPNLPKGKEIAVIETKYGKIYIDFFDKEASEHSRNFKNLTGEGFFNGTTFHRVIPGIIIQGGDPLSKDNDRNNDGTGGPGYTLKAEIKKTHLRGTVAAARLADDINPEFRSSGSQFYICLKDLPSLDNKYTVFGKVVDGLNIIDSIGQVKRDPADNPIDPITMKVYLIKTKP